ncbi:LPD1 domain-containing protein [Aquimarina sp. 2201CG1-2-11]|uniref:LPD1 domain-containing protein n=1 Tax=Aquimarina discodermiae TaxID=3231043 RepID=UPI0034620621
MNYPDETYNSIGKIEDAGKVVQGGGIDRYWDRQGISLDFKKLFNDRISNDWLFDSELALKEFNLRSIEFGNWMSQQDRANFLYASALSLHHLALLYDLKHVQIGLNGKLSLALGARGTGNAKAHYEPLSRSVINLTKTKGIGSLAHEFAHALDNLISFHTGQKKQPFVSGGDTTRKGYNEYIAKHGNYFEKQFEELFNILYYNKNGDETTFLQHIKKETDYWNQRNEVFARTFEVYTHYKLDEQGIKNQFLVKPSYKGKVYPDIKLVLEASRHLDNIIKRGFNLLKRSKPLSGIVTVSGYEGFRKTLKKNAGLNDTLENMQRIARRDAPQVKALAESLQGDTVAATAENIWNYLRENTRYKLDQNGIEELRTPARSLVDGNKGLTDPNFGIDCDDYTILISAMLLNLGIRHEYRVTAYKQKGKFGHIYPVAFDASGNAFVLDVVPEIPHFNYEAQPIIDLKTIPMELHELSGVDTAINSLIEEEHQAIQDELNQPFELSGFDEDTEEAPNFMGSFLHGFGEVATEEEAEIVLNGTNDVLALIERGFLAELQKAKLGLLREQKNVTIYSKTLNIPRELALLTTIIQKWRNATARDAALQEAIHSGSSYINFYKAIQYGLSQLDDESLQGFDDQPLDEPIYIGRIDDFDVDEDFEDDQDETSEVFELGELDGRSRRRRRRARRRARRKRRGGFFKRIGRGLRKVAKKAWKGIKKLPKKVGKGLKKAWKFIKTINPLTVAARAAIRLVLSTNLFKIASRLIYGYLTEAQAKQKGLDLNEWRKIVRAKDRAEKFYTRLGGKAKYVRRSIVKGRAAKKTGLRLGAVASTTTATAAASPFILFMKKILKFINPARLFKKIKDKIKGKKNNQGVSVPQTMPSTSTPTTMPVVPTHHNTMHTDTFVQPPSFNPTTNSSFIPQQHMIPQNPSGIPTANLSFKDKAIAFFKRHKKKFIIGGISGIIIIVGVVMYQKQQKKKKRSLAGVKAARTRARNRKRALGAAPKRTTTRRISRSKPKTLAIGSASLGRAKTRKRSNTNRLKQMHAKAKQLQKKHPKTKYSTLLKRASKMI